MSVHETGVTTSQDISPELIHAAQTGDEEALEEVGRRILERLRAYFIGKVPESEIDDLVAESSLTLVASLPTYREQGKFLPWLYTIAYTRMMNFYRHYQRRISRTLQESDLPIDIGSLPRAILPDDSLQIERKLDVYHPLIVAIQQLPIHQREVLLYRFALGLSLEETAEKLQTSIGGVKSTQHRAITTLRNQLRNAHKILSAPTGNRTWI